MKTYIFSLLFVGTILVTCYIKFQPEILLQQKAKTKTAGAVTLDGLYKVVTKDGETYNDVKIHFDHIGCFIIDTHGYIFIRASRIKTITEVKDASTNSTKHGRNLQRQPKDR